MMEEIREQLPHHTHPLLHGRKTARTSLLVLVSSDRGLCGSFNTQLVKTALQFYRERKEPVRVLTVGRKTESALRRQKMDIFASFPSIANAPGFERSRSAGTAAWQAFQDGEVDRVFVCYADFRSTISQVPTIVQLLPLIPEEDLAEDAEADEAAETGDILFEPSPRSVLDQLVPRLLDIRLYQAMLESAASEHSARMMAMRNATEAADEMTGALTLTFNRARQAGITAEISEISAGKAALDS